MNAKYLFGAFAFLGKAGLTGISGAATTYSTGATTRSYSINGKAFEKAQVSGGATPTTGAVSGAAITLTANNGRAVVWGLNAAGAVQLIEGPIVPLDSAGNFITCPLWGDLPDTFCPFAYTLHKAGSTLSGTFTIGSSNWNTTGMTHTVVDVMVLPDRPQIS